MLTKFEESGLDPLGQTYQRLTMHTEILSPPPRKEDLSAMEQSSIALARQTSVKLLNLQTKLKTSHTKD